MSLGASIAYLRRQRKATWPAHELLAELEQHQTPVDGLDPLKQVQTAMSRLVTDGLAVRIARSTVRAAKFVNDDLAVRAM